jgi:hypothetical protein
MAATVGALLVVLGTAAAGQTMRTWTPSPGGNNYWHTSTNWTPTGVPEFEDTILVGTNANIFIEHPVDIGGTLKWGGGSLSSTYPGLAGWTIASIGTVEINGPLEYSGQLTNFGTLVLTNDALLHMRQYSRLRNQSDGVVRLTSNNEIRAVELNAWIENRGLLLQDGAGRTGAISGSLHHHGVVEARGGTMIGRNYGWTGYDGCRYVGTGTNQLLGGLLQDGTFVSSNLWLIGSGLQGTNTLLGELFLGANARIDRPPIWGVSTSIAPGSRLVVAGDASFNTVRITNSGVLELRGDLNLTIQWSSTVVNEPGGVIRAVGNNRLTQWAGPNLIVNRGVFVKDGGAGPTSIELPFENHGDLEARDGVLEVGGSFIAQAGSRFTGAGTNLVSGINHGPLTVAGPIVSSNLWLMAGGTLQGTGSIAGVLHWSGGLLGQPAPNGPLTLATNCVLDVVGADDRWLLGIVTNAGHIRVADGSKFGLNNVGSRLVNLPGALFEFAGDGILTAYDSGPVLENRGTVRKSGGTGAALLSYAVTVENHALMETVSGNLELAGSFHALFGSRLEGATEVRNGNYLAIGDTFADDLLLAAGTVKGTGAFSGTLRWSSGGSVGPFTLATNGTLDVVSGVRHDLNGSLTNRGLIVLWDNAELQISGDANARLMNLPGGVIDIRSDNSVYPYNYSGGPVLENHGLVRRSAGTGTALISMGPFENHGRVEVQSGILRFQNGLRAEAGSRFEGPVEVNVGDFILNGDTYANDLRLLGGNSIHGPGRFSGFARWTGGYLAGQGPFSLNTNGVLELAGTGALPLNQPFTNAGIVRLTGSTSINLSGADSRLVNLPGGLVELTGANRVDAGGEGRRFVNQGEVRSLGTGTTAFHPLLVLENAGVIAARRGTLQLPGDNYTDAGGTLRARLLGPGSNAVVTFWQPLFLPMARLAGDLEPGFVPAAGAAFTVFDKLAVAAGSPAVTNLPAGFVWRIDSRVSASDVPLDTTFTFVGPVLVEVGPTIIAQPQSRTVFVGQNVMFAVQLEGTAPLYSQWKFNDGVLPDATNTVLTLTNVSPDQAGGYSVLVTNGLGMATSDTATLSVVEFQLASGMTPQGFRVMIPTLPGAQFRVEANSDLATNVWEQVEGLINGDGQTFEFLDPDAPTANQRYYRVLLLP